MTRRPQQTSPSSLVATPVSLPAFAGHRRADLLEQERALKTMLGELETVAEKCRAELARLQN